MRETAAPAVGFTLGYRPSFDGIRGIAVLIVVFSHSFISSLHPAATLAIQTFFVLSGFLITVLLVQEREWYGAVRLGRFYARRALRLLPALVVFLAISTLFVIVGFPDHLRRPHYEASLATLLYVYNWALIYGWIDRGNILGHCWSLAVEEQFYLVWPLLLVGLLRLPVRRFWKLALVAAGIVASLFQRAGAANDLATSRVFIGTDVHADVLLLGCLLGLAACWGMLPRRQNAIRVAKGVGFGALVLLLWHLFYWGEDWASMMVSARWQVFRVGALGGIFLALVATWPKSATRILETPLLLWVGRRSYGLYIWHSAIVAYLATVNTASGGRWGPQSIAIAAAILSVVIAAASFRWVESPFLRMKTRFSAEPSSKATVRAQTGADPLPAARVDA